VTTIVGNGRGELIGEGDPLDFYGRIAADSLGNIFGCSNSRVHKISMKGKISFFAGNGNPQLSVDGIGTNAMIPVCAFIAVDPHDFVYVLQGNAGSPAVRRISQKGEVSTLSYGPFNDFGGIFRSFTVDSFGNFYVSLFSNVYKFMPNGDYTIYGNPSSSGFADGVGTNAMFYYPGRIAVDEKGHVFVVDPYNKRIRKIHLESGNVITLAGNGNSGTVDGIGTNALFTSPGDIAVDANGNVFVTDHDGNSVPFIKKISSDGVVSTISGGN